MNTFNNSVYIEIISHIIDRLPDFEGTEIDDLHSNIFNTDLYLVYYSACNEWLKNHNICVFHAIEFVQEYENENFGETHTAINSEAIVNMLVYIIGEEILTEIEFYLLDDMSAETITILKSRLNQLLQDY